MYASIVATNFLEFYVRVYAEPTKETTEYRVYEIVGTPENSGINIHNKKKGTVAGKYMYLAINNNNILFIYNEGLILEIGSCTLTKDKE